jgi:hypothetical protein
VRADDEPVALRGHHDERPQPARAAQDELVGVELPCPSALRGGVRRTGAALYESPVGKELEPRAPSRPRKRMRRATEDLLVARVLLVGVEPAAEDGFSLDRQGAYVTSLARGPRRHAFMRAAWPVVNMNIASSST